jgi:hypothetical protein
MGFSNRFGWSLSREAAFDACARRYYFHYYLSWGGWQAGAASLVREAFLLKRLVSLPLWRGQLVHYVASKVLRSMQVKGRIPDRDAVIRYTLERFDAQIEFSRAKRYLSEPKKSGARINVDWLALFDHEYGRDVPEAAIARTREECTAAVSGLLASPMLEAALQTDRARWTIENLDAAEFAQTFPFGGATVYVKTDFMFRGAAGELSIVDWKTTRPAEPAPDADAEEPGDASAQLGVYAYYAARVLGAPVESVRLYEVKLLEGGAAVSHAASRETIAAAEDRIARGITRLASVLEDADIARNEALAPRFFPLVENGRCRFCNFYRICKDERNPHRLL